ncbi:MAG TPA: AAA family ATPase [Verrucomicrobiales bacterium]|nr:AAA family ATPase [Verrucomicrobiales bacterium]
MRIEWIEVENFKGFDRREFEFDEHFTLIVGENGSGKSSLWHIVAIFMEAWAHHSGISRDFDVEAYRKHLRVITTTLESGSVSEYSLPLNLRFRTNVLGQKCAFHGSITDADAPQQVFEDISSQLSSVALEHINDNLRFQYVLPVVAGFPAARSFKQGKPDWRNIMAASPFRKDGYEDWDQANDSASSLIEWMGRQEAISAEDRTDTKVYTSVKRAITSSLPGAVRVWFSARAGEPVIEWNTGLVIGFSKLSDGQRSIVSMIGDIARRTALLNPHLDDPVDQTPGIVFIDEIDLHLHPRWQRRIMEDLRRVFPKIQFIATTHSPVIISAAKDAKVIHLDANGSHELGQAYGLDVGWVVDEVMGGESRPAEISALIRQADDCIGEGKLDEARAVVKRLRDELNGPDLEVIRLDSTIENLEALANAED